MFMEWRQWFVPGFWTIKERPKKCKYSNQSNKDQDIGLNNLQYRGNVLSVNFGEWFKSKNASATE